MSERITAAEATEILRDLARGREDGNGADVWPLYDRAEDAMATVVTLTDDAAAHRTRADSAERDADALRRELARERARAEAEEAARAAAQHTADTLGVRLTAAEAAREAFEASVYAELRAAEGECARLRSLLDVTARELVAAKASAEGWREEVVGLRARVEQAESERDAARAEAAGLRRVSARVERIARSALDELAPYALPGVTRALDALTALREATPPDAATQRAGEGDDRECGHPVEMHRGADRCGAHGCGCDRNAEEAGWSP